MDERKSMIQGVRVVALALIGFFGAWQTGYSQTAADWEFTPDNGTPSLRVYDQATHTDVTARSPINLSPATGAIDLIYVPTRNKIFVVHTSTRMVSVISRGSLTVVNTLDLSATYNVLFAIDKTSSEDSVVICGANATNALFSIISTDTLATNTIDMGPGVAKDVAIKQGVPDRAYILVSVGAADYLKAYDIFSGSASPAGSFPGPAGMPFRKLAIDPTKSKIYVTGSDVTTYDARFVVFLISSNTFGSVKTVVSNGPGTFCDDVIFHPTDPRAYIACSVGATGTVTTIDTTTDTPNGASTSFGPPQLGGLSFHPGSNRVYCGTLAGSATPVRILNLNTSGDLNASFSSFSAGQCPVKTIFTPPNIPPFVNDICPMSAQVNSNIGVSIFGNNFKPGTTVDIGGTPASPVNFVSPGHLDIVTPSLSAGTYQVTITNPDLQATFLPSVFTYANPVTQTMTILPGDQPWQYQMISIPAFVRDIDARNALVNAFGPYDPGIWRVFRWDSSIGGYREFSSFEFTKGCNFIGQSMWILSRFGGTLNVPGLDSSNATSDIWVELEPGWNQIGPTGITIDWSTVTVGTDPSSAVSANSGILTLPDLFGFDSGGYFLTTTLEVGKGYWVKNISGSKKFLFIPAMFAAKPGQILQTVRTRLSAGHESPPPPPGYASGSGDGGGGGGGGGGCYVSTAVFGPENAGIVALFVLLFVLFTIKRLAAVRSPE